MVSMTRAIGRWRQASVATLLPGDVGHACCCTSTKLWRHVSSSCIPTVTAADHRRIEPSLRLTTRFTKLIVWCLCTRAPSRTEWFDRRLPGGGNLNAIELALAASWWKAFGCLFFAARVAQIHEQCLQPYCNCLAKRHWTCMPSQTLGLHLGVSFSGLSSRRIYACK